ncbi:polysaccharide pyruvyl transferase family protein [Roseiconus lacunae]|uniref:polysaccharide pyruvyl transferase family protein n=1 Tax=Roseiconus lacunae TaxID=2605694 RepID=UPI0030895035|nr:polysaccharide pyruvyl transferase family protein [Stieleria sp. HD01]
MNTPNAPKFAVVGNYSCANRGDCAILRGLCDDLERRKIQFEVFSEHPEQGEKFFGKSLTPTPLASFEIRSKAQWLAAELLMRRSSLGPAMLSVSRFRRELGYLRRFDGIIFAGGSYFVDIYGAHKYLLPAFAGAAKIPFALCGHSIGPFETSDRVRSWASAALSRSTAITLRDTASREHAERIGIPLRLLVDSADTAWIKPESRKRKLYPLSSSKQLVAISARDLSPFEKRLGIKKRDVISWMAACIDQLIELGVHPVGLSTCTSYAGYRFDDRVILKEIQGRLTNPSAMSIIEDELNDLEIAGVYERCDAVLSMRMHATILAMRAGTPAFIIPYEHKSSSLFRQAGMEDRIFMPCEVQPKEIASDIFRVSHDKCERSRISAMANAIEQIASQGVGVAVESLLHAMAKRGRHASPAECGLTTVT